MRSTWTNAGLAVLLAFSAATASGCAAVALGAGAAGGYAAAKDMEDGKLIDSRSNGNDVNSSARKVDRAFD